MGFDSTGGTGLSLTAVLGLAMFAAGCGPSHHVPPAAGSVGLSSPLAAGCDSLERLLDSLSRARSKTARVERRASSFEYRYAGGRAPACELVIEDHAAVPSPF